MDVTPTDQYGATLLHYAAGYAPKEDVAWLIQKIKSFVAHAPEEELLDLLNNKDNLDMTAMHWVAIKGNQNPGVVQVLLNNKIKLKASGKNALLLALDHEHILCEEFLAAASSEQKEEFSVSCVNAFDEWALNLKKTHFTSLTILNDDMKPFYVALHCGKLEIAKLMMRYDENVINQKGSKTGRTALHWATVLTNGEVFSMLCTDKFGQHLLANEEDYSGNTPLDYAVAGMRIHRPFSKEMTRVLMERQDIRTGLSTRRQRIMDVANVCMVTATLITGASFAAWLQPPNAPVFWMLNTCSFFFAVLTIFLCLDVILLKKNIKNLRTAATYDFYEANILYFFLYSVMFVILAFIAAGFSAKPSSKYQYRTESFVLAMLPCTFYMVRFVVKMFYSYRTVLRLWYTVFRHRR